MRWLLGIILAMLSVFAVNGYMLYLALRNPATVEASYQQGER